MIHVELITLGFTSATQTGRNLQGLERTILWYGPVRRLDRPRDRGTRRQLATLQHLWRRLRESGQEGCRSSGELGGGFGLRV
jgi:hypothetical protein